MYASAQHFTDRERPLVLLSLCEDLRREVGPVQEQVLVRKLLVPDQIACAEISINLWKNILGKEVVAGDGEVDIGLLGRISGQNDAVRDVRIRCDEFVRDLTAEA